jgi:monovalent cation/hydrogen antiporter
VEVTISVFSGYFAYLPAEALGVSGVIAAVTTGIYMGWYTPILTTPETRMQGHSIWQILTFVLNALLFLLVGLQLPAILDSLSGYATGELVGWALLVSAAVILVRIVCVYAFTLIADREPRWRPTAVIAWSGMRGAVSLAAALAIPTDVAGRDLLIFLALAVIFATLVLQGLTLGPLIDVLDLEDDGTERAEETLARVRSAEAAAARLEELAGEEWVNDDTVGRLQGLYAYRQRRFGARLDGDGDHVLEKRSKAYRKLMRQLIHAERAALIAMRNSGEISDEVRRAVERDLDLEESRLG